MGDKIYTKAEREQRANGADEQRAIALLGDANRMLAEVRDAASAKHLMDVAAAAALYAKKAKLGADAVMYATGIKLDAERKLGKYLRSAPKARGGGDTSTGTREIPVLEPPTLADLGLSKKQASEAQRLASIPDETFARVKVGEIKPTVALREQRRSELGQKIASLPPDKYRVIYADPPWKYGDERGGLEKADTAAEGQYPTMATSAICELADHEGRTVRDLAADDAVLFMWATFPLLEDGLEVIRAWGFKYKTAFVWDKQRSNIGNYHDARAELLMIATRGTGITPEVDKRPNQIQSIARAGHSAKPEPFRELIDFLYPSGPRVELFRRGIAPMGWTVWGNESES